MSEEPFESEGDGSPRKFIRDNDQTRNVKAAMEVEDSKTELSCWFKKAWCRRNCILFDEENYTCAVKNTLGNVDKVLKQLSEYMETLYEEEQKPQ